MVASIMVYSVSGSSAKVLNRLPQTPFSAHRENRLYSSNRQNVREGRAGAELPDDRLHEQPVCPCRCCARHGRGGLEVFNSCKLIVALHNVSKAASIKKAPMNHASRGYHTRVAPRVATAVRPPLLFEQQLDDRPLVGQIHARPVRRVDRNRL
jgi:hypothetical protein